MIHEVSIILEHSLFPLISMTVVSTVLWHCEGPFYLNLLIQVLSTVLLNIIPESQQPLNLTSTAKINPQEWGRGKGYGQPPRDTIMTESEVEK